MIDLCFNYLPIIFYQIGNFIVENRIESKAQARKAKRGVLGVAEP